MKKKSFVFVLIALIFSLCGCISFFQGTKLIADGASLSASVWDGVYPTEQNVTDSDYFTDDASNYYIRSAKGLAYFASLVNKTEGYASFKNKQIYLETDIDLNDFNWTPIGNGTNVFQGTFNGQGHYIFNMRIDNISSNETWTPTYVGFFGSLTDRSAVKDTHFRDVKINVKDFGVYSRDYYVGSIVGHINNTEENDPTHARTYIQDCSASGVITTSFESANIYHVGGLAGAVTNSKIIRSYANIDIDCKTSILTSRIGGIVGSASAMEIQNSFSEGNISANAGYVGGLIGYATGKPSNYHTTILDSYNVGDFSISASDKTINVGGVVGRVDAQTGIGSAYFKMQHVYNAGNLSGSVQTNTGSYVGGLVGYIQSPSINSTTMTDCFNVGQTKVSNATQDVVYSSSTNGLTVKNVYCSSGNILNSGVSAIYGLEDYVKTVGFYGNTEYWDSVWELTTTVSIWRISVGINNGYPYLFQTVSKANPNNDDNYSNVSGLDGEGTIESPYIIETAADLGWLSFNYDLNVKYYVLKNDIDLTGKTWQPIGTDSSPFKGVFDGNNCTISGMTSSLQEQFSYYGLFGVTEDAVIKNLKIDDVQYLTMPTEESGYVGALIGEARGNTYIINTSDRGEEEKSIETVGKIAGQLYLIYGQNNATYNGDLKEKTIKVSAGNVKYGYDVEISANGGFFAKKTTGEYEEQRIDNLYYGEYHFLVMPNEGNDRLLTNGIIESNIIRPVDSSENKKIIDSSYGENLPQLSHLYTKTDVIVKVGNKALGYKYICDNSSLSFNYVSEQSTTTILLDDATDDPVTLNVDYSKNILKGFEVNWEKKQDVALTVIYNAYEAKNFGVEKKDLYVSAPEGQDKSISNLDVDDSGYVYRTVNVRYDSFLQDSAVFETPQYLDASGNLCTLRSGDFYNYYVYKDESEKVNQTKIRTLYGEWDNENNKFCNPYKMTETTFVNSALVDKLYVRWTTDSEKEYRLKLNFETAQGFEGNVSLARTIEKIELINSDGGIITTRTQLEDDETVSLYFKVNYSDTLENYLKLNITLKDGYSFTNIGEERSGFEAYHAKIDTNFGLLNVESEEAINVESVFAVTRSRDFKFYNLVDDYEMLINIRRIESSNTINIGEGVYFGFSPMVENWTTVSVLSSSESWTNVASLISETQKDENGKNVQASYLAEKNLEFQNKYIGYDFVNRRIMTSNESYDSFELAEQYIFNNSVSFKYDLDYGTSRYFSYVYETEMDHETETEYKYISLYEMDSSLETQINLVAKLLYESNYIYQIKYLTNSTFALNFSTETKNRVIDSETLTMFGEKTEAIPEGAALTTIKIEESLNGVKERTKVLMTFNDIININKQVVINVNTTYTRAVVNIKTMYLTDNGQLVEFGSEEAPSAMQAPVLNMTSADYSVEQAGAIEFTITSSYYTRFFIERSGSSGVVLYNSDNYGENTGVVNTSNSFNIQISGSNNDWLESVKTLVNNYNDWYFSAHVESTAAHWVTTEGSQKKYQLESYKITLNYDASKNDRGLQAGFYQIVLVCTDVLYSLNYKEGFIDVGENINDGVFDTETDSQISLTTFVDGYEYTSQGQRTIKYGDAISVETYMTENFAYEFVGWYIQGANGVKVVLDSLSKPIETNYASLDFAFNDINAYYMPTTNELTNPYNIKVTAVYRKKSVEIVLSEAVLIYDENGNGTTAQYIAQNKGLSLSFGWRGDGLQTDSSVANRQLAQYAYISLDQSSSVDNYNTQLSGLYLAKSNSGNNLGYYFVGYKLVDKDGNVIDQELVTDKNSTFENDIDLYQAVKDQVELGNTTQVQRYTLLAVLMQKTADIYFHSGTGTSMYGDQKETGEVFAYAEDGEQEKNSTDSVFQLQNVYFGRNLYLRYGLDGILDNETVEGFVVDELFYFRTGYHQPGNSYWAWYQTGSSADKKLNGSTINLTYDYFATDSKVVSLHFYKLWVANSYRITFNSNGGSFDETTIVTLTATYESSILDGPISTILTAKRVGYDIDSWALDVDGKEKVFDEKMNIIDGNTVFDANGNFVTANNINLYAVWDEKPYEIHIVLNGANSYEINGTKTVVDLEEQKDFSLSFAIKYDSTFENLIAQDQSNVEIKDISLNRRGYIFNGFYIIDGNRNIFVNNDTVFNGSVATCNLDETPALTLYAGWIFDQTYLDISLTSYTLDPLVYNALQQTVYVSQYFEIGYEENGYIVSLEEDNKLSITVAEDTHSYVVLSLSSGNATIADSNDMCFMVRNVDTYIVTLSIYVYDDTKYMNLGNISSETLTFYIQVEKARLDTELSDATQLNNVKRIMKPIANSSLISRVEGCTSFDSLVSIMKSLDNTISSEVTNQQIYEYLMTKYFLIIDTNDGEMYKTYKEWNFEAYQVYLTENDQTVKNIVTNLEFFSFYDHTNTESSVVLEGYDNLMFVSRDVENVISEIAIDNVMITSTEGKFVAGNFYEVRLYLKNAISSIDYLSNYDVNYDRDNKAYLVAGIVYLLKEVITIENFEEVKTAYYEEGITNKQIDWVGDRETLEYDDRTYYKIEEGLYLIASLYTSNAGSAEVDTEFSYKNDENYLYFTNVNILAENIVESEVIYVNASQNFKLVMAEDDIFTILNTDGIINFTMRATYLTIENGAISFDTVDSNLASELLRITSVKYTLDGFTEKEFYASAGLEKGVYTDGSVLICEVKVNNANEVSLFLSKPVTKVTFSTTTTTLGDYISLYKWADIPVYGIDGTMENSGSITIGKNSLTLKESGLTEINHYAIYTDLVLVNYNLNFPTTYKTESSTTTTLKLGESVVSDLSLPDEQGFVLSSIKAKTPAGETVDYTEIFTGEDYGQGNVFVGISSTSRHAVVYLDVKWEVADLEYFQLKEEYVTAVHSFDSLSVSDIILLLNKNTRLYEYEYEWYFNEQLVATGESLKLKNQGSFEESGTYKLIVSANLFKEFYVTLEDSGKNDVQIEIEFTMEFVRNKLQSITLPDEESLEHIYDGKNHAYEWQVSVEYFVYSRATSDYSENATVQQLYYITTGSIYFKIYFNENEVSTMKNAGQYRVFVCFDEGIFDTTNVAESDREFVYTITPFSVDLSPYNFTQTKIYNSLEPSLDKSVYLANENVTLSLTRAVGEDVGTYDMFLNGIPEELKNNYTLTYEDIVLFENGTLTEDALTTPIGEFTISASGVLKLSYEITTDNPLSIQAPYSQKGYSVKLTENFALQILNGTDVYKEFALQFYDVSRGTYITDTTALQTQLNDIVEYFDNGSLAQTIYDSGIYSYAFIVGENFGKYYSNVEFEQGYQFVINKITIDVSTFNLDKVYDGETVKYIDINGNDIDLSIHKGVYLTATYSTTHVSTSTRVNLELNNNDEAVNLGNYILSSSFTTAKINKLKATMKVSMSRQSFVYGEISTTSLTSLVDDDYVVENESGEDISNLLVTGYYKILFSLPASVQTNEKGFLYVGDYTLQAESEFYDFDMTLDLPSFSVSALPLERLIPESYIKISVLDAVQEYYQEEITVAETGDTIKLRLVAEGLTAGQTASVGKYNLIPTQTAYASGSILLSVNEENNGLEVLYETETLYMQIDDKTILTQNYNGQKYIFTVDSDTKILTISNGITSLSSNLSFYIKNEDGDEIVENSILTFSSIIIHNLQDVVEFTDSGNYKLSLTATCAEYANVVFAEEYIFEVAKKTIDVSKIVFSKTYDADKTLAISTFKEKVDGDDVSILANFDNANAGEEKSVTLYLNGTDTNNYNLSQTSTTGRVQKADAVATLTTNTFVYGKFMQSDVLGYVVKSAEQTVYSSQYSLTLQIKDTSFSAFGYLEVGEYTVEMTSFTSANYNIIFTPTTLTISPYELDVILTVNGEITTEFGTEESRSTQFVYDYFTPLYETIQISMTREEGTEIGYYKVLAGTIGEQNYVLNLLTDESTNGAYRIVQASERLYLLLNTQQTVLANDVNSTITITYDGKLYDTALIEENGVGTGVYKLTITNSVDSSIKQQFDLNFYTYNSTTETYTKSSAKVDGLTSTIKFLYPAAVQGAGTYEMYASGTTSTNYDVRIGKATGLYCYYLKIEKRELYFTESTLTKVFDNKDAIFEYEDASTMLTGVVQGESVSLTVKFTKDGNVAKYVGVGYDVEGEISGDTTANYNLNLSLEDGATLTATISRAPIKIIVNSQTFVYGQEIELNYKYATDIDLTGYDTSRVSIRIEPDANDNYSTSGALGVGEYNMLMFFSANDFIIEGYVVDNNEQETLTAKVYVVEKELQLVEKSQTLQNVFTKAFDDDNSVDIKDESGNLLFDISGIVSSTEGVADIVDVKSATYQSKYIGESIQVDFELSGTDSKNYTLSPWLYGIIRAVIINLNFDYQAEGQNVYSNVENNGLETISQLLFPFMSESYLTSNSASQNTNSIKNFPTILSGKTGNAFLYWTMNFENIENGSVELAYLEQLVESLGMQSNYDGSTYAIRVDNDDKTVKFLNELISYETDLFGVYYKDNADISITFTANWDINKYRILVAVADETGKTANYGKVVVSDGDNTTEDVVVTNQYAADYNYDSTITFTATPNEYCTFYGFYDATGKLYTGTENYITISKDGNADIFTISNIRQVYNLVVRFTSQKINLVVDLSDYSDATLDDSNYTSIGDGQYQYSTNYLTVKDLFVADLPIPTRVGYSLIAFSTTNATIQTNAFETTLLTSLFETSEEESITVVFKPEFEAVGVVVTMDYGYDEKIQQISVPFGQSYDKATGWVESPIRTGYDFIGWYNENDQKIVGTDVLATVDAHTLHANWEIQKFVLTLNSPNADIFDANIEFEESEGQYIANEIDFNSTITFKVSAHTGYEIYASWANGFDVVINEDKTANVSFTMPANDVEYAIPVGAKSNHVTMIGENVAKIEVFEVAEQENIIETTQNSFDIQTGKVVKIVVTGITGYHVSDEVLFDNDEGLVINKQVDEGILTITIEGIGDDLTITFVATERTNKVEVVFDDISVVQEIDVDDMTYNDIDTLPVFEATTNSTFIMYIKFKHGYAFDECLSQQFDVSFEFVQDEDYYGYYKIQVTNINKDGSVLIKTSLATFTLTVEVLSYDGDKNEVSVDGNKAFANGQATVEVAYNSEVTLSYQLADLYSFAGWSKDGESVFGSTNDMKYIVTANETIYAIFSALKFNIEFATYNYYTIYNEYNSPSKIQTVYNEIPARYFDAETQQEISRIELYYGSNKTIKFKVPEGYSYYGYGYKQGDELIYLDIRESAEQEVTINISSLSLDDENIDVKIYVVVKAYSISMNIETKIDIDGVREQDIDVGWIEMQDRNEGSVNDYGYIDGTRVHYAPECFENGNLLSNKKFTVVGYTGDDIYLKIKVEKVGYKFLSVVSNNNSIELLKIKQTDEYIFYQITNLVGGIDGVEIEVLFKPVVNVINLSFVNEGLIKVDGGAFSLHTTEENSRKVWTSGREYSSVVVSAYTDSSFEVVAYIRAGFYVDAENLMIQDASGIIVEGSLSYQQLSITDTGYTGKISFVVSEYLGVHSIAVGLKSSKYTVKLNENDTTLVQIKNVSFNTVLDLTQSNFENITIYDDRIAFVSGKLKVALQKDKHHFEGYFTYPNGAGVQYINSNGEAINRWKESGYVLNTLTSKYEIAENVEVNAETGEITITLYLYWSYLKTRISFEFVPDVNVNISAQDMITGVDYTNSWFYDTAPMYIEIAFNTDIHVKAPEISGYKFYKFVISQKNAEGVWLSDVIAFADEIPWSTNEYDRIVECKIQIVYFAQVEVNVFGGEGSYEITQDATDTQAKVLLKQGYVDTTKYFQIQAIAEEGYEFLRWMNTTAGSSTFLSILTMQIDSKVNLVMNLQGMQVTLDFYEYDTTFGQITTLRTQSLDGSYSSFRLGGYSGDEFFKIITQVDARVGDEVTFILSIDYGFGVTWNRTDIVLKEYSGNEYYFTMTVQASDVGQVVEILPQFKDEVLAIYISSSFIAEDILDETLDFNAVNLAGYTTFNGKKTTFITCENETEVRIGTVVSARYAIDNIVIKNYDRVFVNMSEFFTEEEIVLTTAFLEENNIIGNIQILIEYTRLLWEDDATQTQSFEGLGTSKNPYLIKTVEDLINMMTYVNAGKFNRQGIRYSDSYYVLMADLDLSEKFWTPIGTETNAFNGTFNFNGHKITGINVAYIYNILSYDGLFGVLGNYAEILQDSGSIWYVYLIVAIVVVVVVLLLLLILINRRRKRRRAQLSTR